MCDSQRWLADPEAGWRTRLSGSGRSGERRGNSLRTGRERRIPAADHARMPDRGPAEIERGTVRIRAGASVVPVEHVFAQPGVPAGGRRCQRRGRKSRWRGIGVGEEGRPRVARMAGPPPAASRGNPGRPRSPSAAAAHPGRRGAGCPANTDDRATRLPRGPRRDPTAGRAASSEPTRPAAPGRPPPPTARRQLSRIPGTHQSLPSGTALVD